MVYVCYFNEFFLNALILAAMTYRIMTYRIMMTSLPGAAQAAIFHVNKSGSKGSAKGL